MLLSWAAVSPAQTATSTPQSEPAIKKIPQRFEALRPPGERMGLVRADLIRDVRKYIRLTDRDKELISMHPEDKIRFDDFLELPKTGFIRLHDAAQCPESRNVIRAEGPCPWGVTGKATAYSFRKDLYTVSAFSDIRNHAGSFQIAGINQLGFLTMLGDDAALLEDLDLQSPGIKAMSDFQPSADVREIRHQSQLATRGFLVGDFIYRADLPIVPGKTYALRSIAYEGKAYRKFGEERLDIFKGDERRDIVVVFRVIRDYQDGSYGILWRELHRQQAPTISAAQ